MLEGTLGEQIDSRGIDVVLDDGEFIVDIIVLAEVQTVDGEKSLTFATSEGTNWLKELGMVTYAQTMLQR